jgi:hypothetical protein
LLKNLPSTPTVLRPENTAAQALQQAQGAHSRFGEQAAQVTGQTLGKNIALKELAASLGLQTPADTIPLDQYSFDSNDKGERCLLPVNFATVVGGFIGEDEEILSTVWWANGLAVRPKEH